MKHHHLNTLAAAGFVTILASIGIISHNLQNGPFSFAKMLDGSTQSAYEERFKSSNPLVSFSASIMGAVKYGVFRQTTTGAIAGQEGWLFTTEELEIDPNFEENIIRSASEVSHVVTLLNQQGITVLPVIVPDKAGIYADQLGVQRPEQIQTRTEVFTKLLTSNGTTFLDVTNVLEKSRASEQVFMIDDTHWSPAGARMVAKAAAAKLANVEYSSAMVKTSHVGQTSFDGDLLAFANTGFLRPIIGPEQQFLDQFETHVASNGGLFNETITDIVIVGTSFSAKSEWHFEGFLKQAFQADVLNFSLEGKGPFEPMNAFLTSETYRTTPPQIIIWEIPARYTSKDMIQ